jgi:uracil-DNA glycosylase
LYDDLGIKRTSGDLTDWHQQGVALLNTFLTTEIGKSLAHQNFGWSQLTEDAIDIYANLDVVALLMGNSAAKYANRFKNSIVTAHPSPLSAYRGFFGTKPFSKINEILERKGLSAINW